MSRKMKDSGIDWIGNIPEKWKTPKLLFVLRSKICDGPHETPNYVDDGIPFISIDSLNDTKIIDLSNVKRFITEDTYKEFCKKITIEKGDILFSKAATIGKTAIVGDETFMVWSPLAVLKRDEKKIDNDYLYYLLNCNHLIDTIALSGSLNTQINVGMREMEQARIPLPIYEEQYRIAQFLDEKCASIDTVIEKTKDSIEEYKKLRQSIITHAVTKGIRDNRKMKESGNIWFGDIPEEWEIKRLKYLFRIRKRIAGEEGHTILSITQKGIVPKDISKNEGQLAQDYSNYQLVYTGDFAMNHMDLLTGWVDISKYDGVTSPDYRVFTLEDSNKNCSQYYLYLMQMCYNDRIFYGLGQGVSGLGRWRLQADKFLNFTVPQPPYEEQCEIADYISEKNSKVDELIKEKEGFLTELQEYKKSLIYEYVTGKKEVV